MKIEELYYFHAFLNYKLFGGKLEAVIIKTFDDNDERNGDMILAQTETELDPFIIFIGKSVLESDPVFTLTVLLHEMVHQYNRQRGAEDIDYETGKHNATFGRVAKNHGLELGGYRLTEETRDMIERQLKHYCYMVETITKPIF